MNVIVDFILQAIPGALCGGLAGWYIARRERRRNIRTIAAFIKALSLKTNPASGRTKQERLPKKGEPGEIPAKPG